MKPHLLAVVKCSSRILTWTFWYTSLGLAQIVVDGSFETPSLPPGQWSYKTEGSAWTFTRADPEGVGSGIAAAPNLSWVVPPGWDGNQVAILQGDSTISQRVTFPATGSYELQYMHAGRVAFAGIDGNQSYDIALSGTVIASGMSTSSGQPFTERKVTFYQYAGTYTLQFRGKYPLWSGDHTAFLDAVTITLLSTNATVAGIWTAVEICWGSETNKQYQPQWSYTTDSTNWFSLGQQLQGTGTNMCLFDSTRGQEKRFYRIITIE